MLSSSIYDLCRVVSIEQGKALAEKWNARYIDASAKENQVKIYCIVKHASPEECFNQCPQMLFNSNCTVAFFVNKMYMHM